MLKRTCIFLLILGLAASVRGEIISHAEEWKTNNAVKKLYDTPLGSVYKIDASADTELVSRKIHLPRPNCKCPLCTKLYRRIDGGILECSFLKRKEKNKRFIVIDLKVRAFPALSGEESSEFRFKLARSEKQITGSTFGDLNGLLEINDLGTSSFSGPYMVFASRAHTFILPPLLHPFCPNFEPVFFRIIFDTRQGEIQIVCNGKKGTFEKVEDFTKSRGIEFRNFALIVSHKKGVRNNYLEIGEPFVWQCDALSETESLRKIDFAPYPYGNYAIKTKRTSRSSENSFSEVKKSNNPDLQYAYAIRYLYGEENECNPAEAVELLKAAAKKKHVLALYQLGICYYRGYGMEPDEKKARRHLQEAGDYLLQNAGAFEWFTKWETRGRPWFGVKSLRKDYNKYIKLFSRGTLEHDYGFLWVLVAGTSTLSLAVSPKFLLGVDYTMNWIEKDTNPQRTLVEYAVSSGYFPAYWNQGVREAYGGTSEKVFLSLQKGVKAGDTTIVPDLIFWNYIREGHFSKEDFTTHRDLLYAEDPLYILLSILSRNENFPGAKQFLSCPSNGYKSYNIPDSWKNAKTPEAGFLTGLAFLSRHRPMRAGFILDQEDSSFQETFVRLKKAAESNIPEAQFFIGRCYYYNDIPEEIQLASSLQSLGEAKKYFEKAESQGHLKASLYLAKMELASTVPNFENIRNRLKKLCSLKVPEAFFLYGETLKKSGRLSESIKFFQQAAEFGEYHAWRSLALMDKDSKPEQNRLYWYRFIQADRKARQLDRGDLFWPNPYEGVDRWRTKLDKRAKLETKQDKVMNENDNIMPSKSSNRIQNSNKEKKKIMFRD